MTEGEKFSDCKFYQINSNCGPYLPKRCEKLFLCSELKDDVSDHLTKEGFQDVQAEVKEVELINNRSDGNLSPLDKVCAYHRYTFGTDWRGSKMCQHPVHISENPQSKKKSQLSLRPACVSTSKKIREAYPHSAFPIGGSLCTKHRQSPLPEQTTLNDTEQPDTDVEYEPPPSEIVTATREVLDEITAPVADVVSPVKFLIRSPVSEVSDSTLRYMKRKYEAYQRSFSEKLCESIAPGQGKELQNILSSSCELEDPNENILLKELEPFIEAYNISCSEKAKVIILSTLDPKKYPISMLMKAFDCTKYKVRHARQIRSLHGPAGEPPAAKKTKMKMDTVKGEHFLDFIFTSGALQDVAYGTSSVKYDSGYKEILPNAVTTCLRNHIIHDYLAYCNGLDILPLSSSTLWNILRAINPKQRHALGGLDNTTADGIDGFDLLQKVLGKLDLPMENVKIMKHKLETAKRYLKLEYGLHCSAEDECPTHCPAFALSNPNDKFLQKDCGHDTHNMTCTSCCNLLSTLDDMKNLVEVEVDKDIKGELEYDVSQATKMIMEWMRHNIRGVQQAKAKSACMENMEQETTLWLKDWAQKVLPQSFREKQSDYFGKKGMSVAVDVFFYKTSHDDILQKTVYFTVLQSCAQDMEASLSVADHVLTHFHSFHPEITKIHIKSDNAGCYAGAACPEMEYLICKEKGMTLLRHDYNEPQKGKDQADRESAVARQYMKAFVNSGHNMTSAQDIMDALLYKGGVKNAFISITDIDLSKVKVGSVKIPNIQSYHSVNFNPGGMTFWQFYDIGVGKLVPYSNIEWVSGTVTIEPFITTTTDHGTFEPKKRSDRSYQPFLYCSEVGCNSHFESTDDLEHHIALGKHTFTPVRTSMDTIKASYSERMRTTNVIQMSAAKNIPEEMGYESSEHVSLVKEKGWGLKPQTTRTRFSKKQKQFILDCFNHGEETGRKMTAEKVVEKLRTARDDQGKIFTPDEYLTKAQVISQFSRMSKLKITTGYNAAEEDIPNNEDLHEAMEEDAVQVLRDEVEHILADCGEDFTDLDAKPGSFVIVRCGQKFYIGQVMRLSNEKVEVKYMRQKASYFVWPLEEDVSTQEKEDIITTLTAPVMDRREHYTFTKEDMDIILKHG